MAAPSFLDRLREIQANRSSLLCVGLDPDPDRLPPHLLKRHGLADAVLAFNRAIIEATADAACAFKLNLAFFEILEERSWEVLRETVALVPDHVLTIADGKRGDIGNSARFYAEALFDRLSFDACTVSGFMGRDSVEPFLQFDGRGVFVLVRTSNPGAADFQELDCGGGPLYERVARVSMTWDADLPGTVGFVVGATDTAPLDAIRSIAPEVPLLIPGVGAQGGDASAVLRSARGGSVLINSSRQIIYASSGVDFAEAAAREAESLRALLEQHRALVP